jgi:hypothetical protein
VVRDIVLPVPVSEIWASLRDFSYSWIGSSTWAECLRAASRAGNDVLGEVHLKGDAQTDDFTSVPIGPSLKVLMMQLPQEEEFILRWGNPDHEWMEISLSGTNHEYLMPEGLSQFKAVRSGMMTVLGSGHLQIRGG